MKRIIAITLVLALALTLAISATAVTTLTPGNTTGSTSVSLVVESTYTVSIPDKVDLATEDSITVSVTDAILPANSTLNLTLASNNYNNGWFLVDKYSSTNTLPYSIRNGTEEVESGDAVLSLVAGVDTSGSATLDFHFAYPKLAGAYQDTLTFKVEVDGGYVAYPAAEGLVLYAKTGTGNLAAYDGTIAGEKDVYVMTTTEDESWKTQVAPHLTVKSGDESFQTVRNRLKDLGYTYVSMDFCVTEGGVALFAQALDSDTASGTVTSNLRLNLNTDGTISWAGTPGDNQKTYITVLDRSGAPVTTYEKGVWYTARFKLQIYSDSGNTVVGFCDANKSGGTIYLGEVRYE